MDIGDIKGVYGVMGPIYRWNKIGISVQVTLYFIHTTFILGIYSLHTRKSVHPTLSMCREPQGATDQFVKWLESVYLSLIST